MVHVSLENFDGKKNYLRLEISKGVPDIFLCCLCNATIRDALYAASQRKTTYMLVVGVLGGVMRPEFWFAIMYVQVGFTEIAVVVKRSLVISLSPGLFMLSALQTLLVACGILECH